MRLNPEMNDGRAQPIRSVGARARRSGDWRGFAAQPETPPLTDLLGRSESNSLRFEWDEHKNERNKRKHSLSFEECVELFTAGVDYLELFDDAHSEDQDRFATKRETALFNDYAWDGTHE